MRSLWSFARNRSRRSQPFIKEGWKEIFADNRSARMGQICFLKRGRRKRGEEREKEGRKKEKKSWGEEGKKGRKVYFWGKRREKRRKKGKEEELRRAKSEKRKIWKNRKKGVDKKGRKWYTKRALFERRPEPEGGGRRERNGPWKLNNKRESTKHKKCERNLVNSFKKEHTQKSILKK